MTIRPVNLWHRVSGMMAGLRRDKRGATAIEFAFLAIPFAMLAFAILETTISFTAQQVLNNAADKIGRQFRTGQLTLTNTTKSEFRDLVCGEISIIVGSGCPELVYDFQNYTDFEDVPTEIKLNPSGDIDETGFGYNPGDKGTINAVRLFYRWPVMTDLMKSSMSSLPNNKTLLYATVTWQNEEF
jgi:Flp pilus assembly protein TadG